MKLCVARLGAGDAAAYRALRLEGLERYPCAFAADHAEEAALGLAEFARRLDAGLVFGARLDGELCGLAALVMPAQRKKRHKATLSGVYVTDAAQGKGVGSALVAGVIERAKWHADQLHAVVVTTNLPARRLYARLGFRPYGIEPRALKVGDDYFDQELLVLCFERPVQFRQPSAARRGWLSPPIDRNSQPSSIDGLLSPADAAHGSDASLIQK
jgi:GNAT superfamily N-acetyltransferase